MFLSLAYTMIKEGHVKVDILSRNFPERINYFLESIFSLLTFLVFAFIGWEYVGKAVEAAQIAEVDPVL
jgi:TRAP-type C4-dicarboxylate transport system permease small subunit